MENNISAQVSETPQATEKKKGFPVLIIVLIFISVLLLGANVYLFIERGKDKNTISDLESNLSQNNNETELLKEEVGGYKNEIDSVQQQLDGYIEKINELENPPYFTNYFPVQYRFGKSQKLGQTFDFKDTQTITEITFSASFGVGGNILFSVYEADEEGKPIVSKVLITSEIKATDIVKGEEFKVLFDNPLVVIPGKKYFFEFAADDQKTQTSIAYAESNVYKDGEMWTYTRLIGGNGEIIDSNHSWQPKNSYDVVFKFESKSSTE